MLLNEYVESAKIAIQKLDDYRLADLIEFQSEVTKEKTAILSIKVILIDKSELYIREYVKGKYGIEKIDYSYQYQAADKSLIFRYDNSKHKPKLGFDEHKHQRDGSIIPSTMPSIEAIIDEVMDLFG